MAEYHAEAVGKPYFTVTGSPFVKPMTMGWHVVTEKGFTVGVANSQNFVTRLNDLEALASWLASVDAAYHLHELIDDGLIDCPSDEIMELLATYCRKDNL